MQRSTRRSGALAEDRHTRQIAAEVYDVVPYELKCHALVQQTHIAADVSVLRRQESCAHNYESHVRYQSLLTVSATGSNFVCQTII